MFALIFRAISLGNVGAKDCPQCIGRKSLNYLENGKQRTRKCRQLSKQVSTVVDVDDIYQGEIGD